MQVYGLYVESGPKRKTTMVHVLDLLGCVANGRTTEEAVESAPDAIRAYLSLLAEHGEAVNPGVEFGTETVIHEMRGWFIGQGDPEPGFEPDFGPFSEAELATAVRWLRILGEAFATKVEEETERLDLEPERGRTIRQVAQHVAEAHAAFLRGTVGRVEGLLDATKQVEAGEEMADGLRRLMEISGARLLAMSEEERTRKVQHGAKVGTARRSIRRMLEHQWEHLREIEARPL